MAVTETGEWVGELQDERGRYGLTATAVLEDGVWVGGLSGGVFGGGGGDTIYIPTWRRRRR
jgi:hypothetical protein